MMQETDKVKTVIGADVEIVGSVKSEGTIQIDGKLNGDLSCSGNVVLGSNANVKGNISADSTAVSGQLAGNITAKDHIELKSTARVNGDIKARRLTVEDGVTFIGKSEVNPSSGLGSGRSVPHAETRPSTEEAPSSGVKQESEIEGERSKGEKGKSNIFGRNSRK